ncbi:MAG: hypothetical protein QM539_03665 [Alphaproteobacteria bacterium]|nr:hypothetical protein [Alphaproteobacteria bacterium]
MKNKLMKTFFTVGILMLTFITYSQTPVAQLSDADITKIKADINSAQNLSEEVLKKGDNKTLETLYSDNFVFFDGAQDDKHKISKQNFLKLIESKQYILHDVNYIESKIVVVSSNLAYMNSLKFIDRSDNGTRKKIKKTIIEFFSFENGVWKKQLVISEPLNK